MSDPALTTESLIADLEANRDRLTRWERDFLDAAIARGKREKPLDAAQRARLETIHNERVIADEAATAEERDA